MADRYRIERELGRGGMATVFYAWDLKHDRPVALKLLHPDLAHVLGPERFLREIRLSARLQHPHILSVLDSGEVSGAGNEGGALLWYTMPFVEGETLRDRLRREGQLPLDEALRISAQAADALHYAHQRGVIHRDIKPENILLSGNHAQVADFGVATAITDGTEGPADRLTETGLAVGTPQYMSPEQSAGERTLDARSDIYALGTVLYEMLAGEPPYTGPTPRAILAKRLTEPLPHLRTLRDVPQSVEDVVTRALARAPADRFSTAAEFGEALTKRADKAVEADKTDGGSRSPRRLVALTGLSALIAVAAYFTFRPHGAPPDGTPSAAVLPFVDLSAEKDQEYFSDGLTDELITALSRIDGLKVAARTSSFQFKNANSDIREVGRKLGVATVVEGSIRKSGNRLRVSAQLVSAKDGYELWSENYDRELADVFAVQEEIARSIVSALQLRLGQHSDSTLAKRPTRDLEAYDLYLKGRFAWNQRTGGSLLLASQYFKQAVARDSGFARAYAGLADASILLPQYSAAPPRVVWPEAKAAAAKALALDSTLAEAHTSLAYGTMLYEWDWPAAEAEFKRAITLDPNYPTAHHWYGDFLAGRGRQEEALKEMRRGLELDPLSRIIGTELAWVYYLMHRDDEAMAQTDSVLRLDPNFGHVYFVRSLVYLHQRAYQKALEAIDRGTELTGFYAQNEVGKVWAHAGLGDTAGARRDLTGLEERAKREFVPPMTLAVGYAALGEKTEAIAWLNTGIDQRDLMMPENFFDPIIDPLRSDPRFAAVERRMGLKP
ncbi:MAG TPA: protein kinase [Gemmatimonadales bacterium]